MVATIAKWGNSLAIRIPQNLAKEINLAEGSEVKLVLIDGKLTIEPIVRRRYSLEELIEAMTPENVHTEIDTGVAVGNEVW
ncbi:AbrB/MazE/SpoVT family DNA-binding domain-containing protein [Microcoleus vaginatus]|jgi:antitoxin MazE|uniref:AbrB/MazE/SpoVT family DNA-binding domain-containing protein n=1 Tax=Microcoleus vaginatus TaxID=119532 RepID=UPI00198BA361|nr:AbrB/MazE/SpoVT family DNA-binding domain-containing protein [Microcoleus sp. T1-bin1]MBD0340020.1 AbrB/MazE/SpoVT family DNA-binding domain-containing protein [Microcoleus sp. Co-bin12]